MSKHPPGAAGQSTDGLHELLVNKKGEE